ncbi:MAG TPA: GAF domain-containing protein [Blastocatellia bacterium]
MSEGEALLFRTQGDDPASALTAQPPSESNLSLPGANGRRSLMSRIDVRINQSQDLAQTLQITIEELGAHLELTRCVLWMIDEKGQVARPGFQYCGPGVQQVSGVVRVSDVVDISQKLGTQGGLITTDARSDHRLRAFFDNLSVSVVSKAIVCLPVEIQGNARAILSMARDKEIESWTEHEVELGQAVADRLALAIRQAELTRQLRESAREAQALYLASNLLVDTSDLDRLYEQILDAVADVFGHPNSNIWLIDDASGEAVISYIRGQIPSNMRQRLRIDGPGLLAHSIRTASIVNVADTLDDERYLPGLSDTRAELLVPLMVDGRVIAVFNLESPVPRAFTKRDERILASFAERAAHAVEQARLYNKAQEAAAREALISRITRLLNQSPDVESTLYQLIEELYTHLKLDWCVLARVHSDQNTISMARQCGLDKAAIPKSASVRELNEMGLPLLEGVPVHGDLAETYRPGPLSDQFVSAGIRSFLLEPVYSRRQLRFIIIALSARARQWTPEDIDLITALAGQASVAWERSELFLEVTASQREWEQTFDAMPEAVFVIDRTRRLSRANLAAAALQGLTSGRPTNQSCCEVVNTTAGVAQCLVEQAISSRQTILKEVVPPNVGRPFLFTVEPTFDSDGASLGAIVIASDLTAIKRAEAEAEKQRELLSRLLEIARDAVFVLDVDSRLSWSNQRLSELSGYPPEELAGMGLSTLIRKEAAGETHPIGFHESFEAELSCKDQTRRFVIANITPIQESGEFTGALGILHDITDVRNAAEKAAQADKLRALGQLAGGVAHNFNNLLAAILGHTQLLKRHLKNNPLAERVEIIERAALDGAAMVRRINSFSMRGSDEGFENVDLTGVVRDSIDITRIRWQDEAQARGVKYRLTFRPEPAGIVSGAASELREVFVNIIFNALDAMASSGGELLIETGLASGRVFASFSDQGVGMSTEILGRVFDPFFTTKGAAGTGLGLSGSHAIIERHGGRIDVESELGRGSRFTVWLPRVTVTPTAAAVTLPGDDFEASAAPNRLPTVMIVVDDAVRRRDLSELLTNKGYSVTGADGPDEALSSIQAHPRAHRIVFADLELPGITGPEFAAQIRAVDPTIRTLLATPSDGPPFIDFDARSKLEAIIAKPFHQDTLLLALDRALLGD